MKILPSFKKTSRLARYIHPDHIARKTGRAKPAAFERRIGANLHEVYLSVNSDEIHTVNQIADIYAKKFRNGDRPVTLTCPTVQDYINSGTTAGLTIYYDIYGRKWVFDVGKRHEIAFCHRPTKNDLSHSGVEFINVLDKFQNFKFASRITRKLKVRKV